MEEKLNSEEIEKVLKDGKDQFDKIESEVKSMQDECVKKIREKLLPFGAQKKLRQAGIDLPGVIVKVASHWIDCRKKYVRDNGTMNPSNIVRWNNDLNQMLHKEIDDLVFSEKGMVLIEILVGKPIDLESAKDGELIAANVQILTAYMHKRVMEKFQEIHHDMLGKSLMKLNETSAQLNTLMSKGNGSKNVQSKKK